VRSRLHGDWRGPYLNFVSPSQNGSEWRFSFCHSRMLLAGIQAEFGLAPINDSGDDLDLSNLVSFVSFMVSNENHSHY
jgi:hypothetical protein